MHLTPLLLAATLALTSTALPTGPNSPTETGVSTAPHGQHRCCPPFKPRNKHFQSPRLPCDPSCTTPTIDQHDETGTVPAGHMIPAHAKEYKQGAPIPKHKSTEVSPTLPLLGKLRHHGGVVHPDHDGNQ